MDTANAFTEEEVRSFVAKLTKWGAELTSSDRELFEYMLERAQYVALKENEPTKAEEIIIRDSMETIAYTSVQSFIGHKKEREKNIHGHAMWRRYS